VTKFKFDGVRILTIFGLLNICGIVRSFPDECKYFWQTAVSFVVAAACHHFARVANGTQRDHF